MKTASDVLTGSPYDRICWADVYQDLREPEGTDWYLPDAPLVGEGVCIFGHACTSVLTLVPRRVPLLHRNNKVRSRFQEANKQSMTTPGVRRALGSRKHDYSTSESLSAAQVSYGTPTGNTAHRIRKSVGPRPLGCGVGLSAVSTYSSRSAW